MFRGRERCRSCRAIIARPHTRARDRCGGVCRVATFGADRERSFLLNETLQLSAPVDADTPLLTSGLVDSLNLAALLDTIEARFGVTVPAESAAESELDTPRQIAEFLSGVAE